MFKGLKKWLKKWAKVYSVWLFLSVSMAESESWCLPVSLFRLSDMLTSTWARHWEPLSKSWSMADLNQAFCLCGHLYRCSNLSFFNLYPPPRHHPLTNTAPPPGLSSKSSPPPQLLRPLRTSVTLMLCESSIRSTLWSRSRSRLAEERRRPIFLISSTRVSRAKWASPPKSAPSNRGWPNITNCRETH